MHVFKIRLKHSTSISWATKYYSYDNDYVDYAVNDDDYNEKNATSQNPAHVPEESILFFLCRFELLQANSISITVGRLKLAFA